MKARARYYIPIFVSILFMAIFFFMDTAKAEECKIFKENDYYYYDFGDGRIYDINHNVIYQLDSSKKIYTVVDYPLNWCTEAYSALAQYDPSIQIRPDGNVVIVDTIKGKKVTAIAEGVFELAQNPVLTSMKIGKNVTTIGKRAFAHCTYMTDVILPASLKKIGEEAFYQTGIVSISIGKNVTSIGRYAFSSCESLEDVNLSDGKLKSLPFGCFAFCESLKSITLPANITKISNHAFYSCDSLQIAKIKGKITSIPEECFYGCKSLKTFTIPSSVTIIKHSAFQGSGLEKITIPKRVKTLETAAFSQTNLKTVSVPSSVKTDNGAFMNCEKLYQIEYTSGTTNMSWARFDGGTGFNLNRVTIVAPKKSVAYKYCYRAGFMTTENKEQKVAKNCNWMVVNENWQFRMMNCGENLKWKSSNNSILKITSNGKAVAKKVGTVTVTGYSDTQKYTFKIKVMKRTLNNVMKVITNETVRPEMSDYEKFCGACIWLGQNVDYDTETYEAHLGDETAVENLKSYTMEGALIDGLAVCQGFSEAFKYIMDYYDIPCRIVTSGPMDHAWNAIQINKKWYFLDTLGGANLFDKSAKGYYGYSFPYKLSDPEKVNWTSRTVSANSKKKGCNF